MHTSVYINKISEEMLKAVSNLNLDSVITSQSKLDRASLTKLRDLGVEVYGEVSCFEGQSLLDKFPDAKPVTHDSTKTIKDWYVGVCPTHEGVLEEVKSHINLLIDLEAGGIWLQFLYYPTKWDEPEPFIMDTCYCDRCISKFKAYVGDEFEYSDMEELFLLIDGSYYQEWLDFKAIQITSMAQYARDQILKSGKDIKLGYFTPPWDESEHRASLQRVLAQERTQLTPIVDVTSPMLYHKMCGEGLEWIKDKVEYFWNLGAEFIPLIQTENITENELEQALKYAVESPSSGVCVLNLENLIEDKCKFEVVKNFFGQLKYF